LTNPEQRGSDLFIDAMRARLVCLSYLSACISALLLCSCVTTGHTSGELPTLRLPDEVAINKGAGRGDLLILTLRLENGKELPFFVDTGASCTCLDKSLEPMLGKRLTSKRIWTWSGRKVSGFYVAPDLYLGNTRLITGKRIGVLDFAKLSSDSGHPIMGLLGMDCLRNYCIGLDFAAGKLQFLDPNHINTEELGTPFRLATSRLMGGCIVRSGSLVGEKGAKTLVDTGCNIDGLSRSSLFHRETMNHKASVIDGVAYFPECTWHGEPYTNLVIRECPGSWIQQSILGGNALGLKFLARHQVTLNFPRQMMYLKHVSEPPLEGRKGRTVTQSCSILSAN
jgi:hypothetical protein